VTDHGDREGTEGDVVEAKMGADWVEDEKYAKGGIDEGDYEEDEGVGEQVGEECEDNPGKPDDHPDNGKHDSPHVAGGLRNARDGFVNRGKTITIISRTTRYPISTRDSTYPTTVRRKGTTCCSRFSQALGGAHAAQTGLEGGRDGVVRGRGALAAVVNLGVRRVEEQRKK